MLHAWKWRSCTKRELLSMIGTLQHASTVVKPGRTFLRRMIDLSKRNVHLRVNTDFHADLQWWATFIDSWNRVSVLSSLCRRPIDAKLRCMGILVVRGLLRQQMVFAVVVSLHSLDGYTYQCQRAAPHCACLRDLGSGDGGKTHSNSM